MFPPKAKKPSVAIAIGIGKPKPKAIGNGSGPKPKSPMDELDGPDPVEGPPQDETDTADDPIASDDTQPDLGQGYGAKLEKDIEDVGAALGMDAGQAKKAAGAFFAAAAQCLSGGDEGDAEATPDGDEMIDTEGPVRPGRYGQ